MALKKLDVRGAKCPIPIVKAKKEIDAMAPGDQLEVTSTDSGSVPDFQGWVEDREARAAQGAAHRQGRDGPRRSTFTCSSGSRCPRRWPCAAGARPCAGPRSSTRPAASAATRAAPPASPRTRSRSASTARTSSTSTSAASRRRGARSRSRAATSAPSRRASSPVPPRRCTSGRTGSSISTRPSASAARPASRPVPTTRSS